MHSIEPKEAVIFLKIGQGEGTANVMRVIIPFMHGVALGLFPLFVTN